MGDLAKYLRAAGAQAGGGVDPNADMSDDELEFRYLQKHPDSTAALKDAGPMASLQFQQGAMRQNEQNTRDAAATKLAEQKKAGVEQPNYDESTLDAIPGGSAINEVLHAAGALGRGINTGVGRLATAAGSPMQGTASQQFEAAMVPHGPQAGFAEFRNNPTLGGAVSGILDQVAQVPAVVKSIGENFGPKAQEYTEAALGPIAGTGAQMALDPITYGGLGALKNVSPAASAVLHRLFQAQMGTSAIDTAAKTAVKASDEGLTPAVVRGLTEAGITGKFALDATRGDIAGIRDVMKRFREGPAPDKPLATQGTPDPALGEQVRPGGIQVDTVGERPVDSKYGKIGRGLGHGAAAATGAVAGGTLGHPFIGAGIGERALGTAFGDYGAKAAEALARATGRMRGEPAIPGGDFKAGELPNPGEWRQTNDMPDVGTPVDQTTPPATPLPQGADVNDQAVRAVAAAAGLDPFYRRPATEFDQAAMDRPVDAGLAATQEAQRAAGEQAPATPLPQGADVNDQAVRAVAAAAGLDPFYRRPATEFDQAAMDRPVDAGLAATQEAQRAAGEQAAAGQPVEDPIAAAKRTAAEAQAQIIKGRAELAASKLAHAQKKHQDEKAAYEKKQLDQLNAERAAQEAKNVATIQEHDPFQNANNMSLEQAGAALRGLGVPEPAAVGQRMMLTPDEQAQLQSMIGPQAQAGPTIVPGERSAMHEDVINATPTEPPPTAPEPIKKSKGQQRAEAMGVSLEDQDAHPVAQDIYARWRRGELQSGRNGPIIPNTEEHAPRARAIARQLALNAIEQERAAQQNPPGSVPLEAGKQGPEFKLAPEEAAKMVSDINDGSRTPEDIVDEIVQKSKGNGGAIRAQLVKAGIPQAIFEPILGPALDRYRAAMPVQEGQGKAATPKPSTPIEDKMAATKAATAPFDLENNPIYQLGIEQGLAPEEAAKAAGVELPAAPEAPAEAPVPAEIPVSPKVAKARKEQKRYTAFKKNRAAVKREDAAAKAAAEEAQNAPETAQAAPEEAPAATVAPEAPKAPEKAPEASGPLMKKTGGSARDYPKEGNKIGDQLPDGKFVVDIDEKGRIVEVSKKRPEGTKLSVEGREIPKEEVGPSGWSKAVEKAGDDAHMNAADTIREQKGKKWIEANPDEYQKLVGDEAWDQTRYFADVEGVDHRDVQSYLSGVAPKKTTKLSVKGQDMAEDLPEGWRGTVGSANRFAIRGPEGQVLNGHLESDRLVVDMVNANKAKGGRGDDLLAAAQHLSESSGQDVVFSGKEGATSDFQNWMEKQEKAGNVERVLDENGKPTAQWKLATNPLSGLVEKPPTAKEIIAQLPTALAERAHLDGDTGDIVIPTQRGIIRVRPQSNIEIDTDAMAQSGYTPDEIAAAKAGKSKAVGSKSTVSGETLLKIVKTGEVGHELMHTFLDHFATDKQRELLAQRFGDNDEAIARGYTDYVNQKTAKPAWEPQGVIGKFYKGIHDFVTNAFRAIHPDANSVLEKIRTGEAFGTEEAAPKAGMKGILETQKTDMSPRLGQKPEIKTKDAVEKNGVVATKDAVAPVSYSVRTNKATIDAARKYAEKYGGFDQKQIDKYEDDINSVAALVHADPDRLDFTALRGASAIKGNGDARYPRSEDYTTLCRRRYILSDTVDAIQNSIGKMLEPDQIIAIRKHLEGKGHEVNCGPCYVESRRIKMDTAVNKAINGYIDKRKGSSTYDQEVKLTPENAKLALSQEGRNQIFEKDPEQYGILSNAFAGLNAKVPIGRAEYKGEILDLPQKTVDAMNRYSGMRSQSWSDFEVPHLLDKMQTTLDRVVRKLKGQSYTKEIEYVESMKDTNEMINMSLIPDGTGFDKSGKLVWNSKQSLRDMKRAREIRAKYNNVGFEAIGISDAHVRALLDSPEIDYVIPYHASGLKGEHQQASNMKGWKDYGARTGDGVPEQNWTDLRTGKALKDVDREVFISEWKGDIKKLNKLCKEREVAPPFQNFKDHPNYYKLLTDRRVFDKSGNFIEQQPMQFKFDMPYIKKMFANYKGAHNENNAVTDVVDHFSQEYGGSKTDTDLGLPLNSDGTVTLYHGTSKAGAESIRSSKTLRSAAEPDVYLTTDPKGGGYGDTVVKVRVDPSKLQLDDEFPDGRRDFRVSVGSKKTLPVSLEEEPAKKPATKFSVTDSKPSFTERMKQEENLVRSAGNTATARGVSAAAKAWSGLDNKGNPLKGGTDHIKGKSVLDFGAGLGADLPHYTGAGASDVKGYDVNHMPEKPSGLFDVVTNTYVGNVLPPVPRHQMWNDAYAKTRDKLLVTVRNEVPDGKKFEDGVLVKLKGEENFQKAFTQQGLLEELQKLFPEATVTSGPRLSAGVTAVVQKPKSKLKPARSREGDLNIGSAYGQGKLRFGR